MSLQDRMATAAILQDSINNPPTHNVTRAAHYNVSAAGAALTFIAFSGTTSRLAVQHNTAGVGIRDIPYKIQIPYHRIGYPKGNISVGIRKAAGGGYIHLDCSISCTGAQ